MTDALARYDALAVIGDYEERARVARLDGLMTELAASDHRMATYAEISRQEGIPAKTLERMFARWKRGGAAALVDGRKATRATPGSAYYADYKTYCERDLNTDKGAYRTMMTDFRAGKLFAFGTWRDVFRAEFPARAVPPFCPAGWTPRGMTYERLNQIRRRDPDRMISTAWNRRGQFAASEFTLPVVRSRVGLPVGAVYQADDVWHNIDVFAPGCAGVFNPLEFAIYDVSSAYKVVSVIKPRLLNIDPKTGKESRDNLKEQQFRFAMQYLVCCKGFHKRGVTFVLERGTTAIRENVQRRVAAVPGFGDLVTFQVSGVLNDPAHKGLMMGNAGGNPRMKSLCECAHGIIHNATASLPGNHGRDAAHKHESGANLVKHSRREIELASRIDPTLVNSLMLGILRFEDYLRYFTVLEDEVMDRTDHDLEGWAGREVMEYRVTDAPDAWRPADELNDMNPANAAAIRALVNTDPARYLRTRKMSRREAWAAGQGELVRWPLFDAPAFADPRDMREAKVRSDGTIQFIDAVYYPGRKMIYVAETVDRRGIRARLVPGTTVRFFFNPLGDLSDHIWIADEEGNVLGMAPVLKTASWCDPESIKAAMGQKMHQVAAQMADTRARHVPDQVARLVGQKVNRLLIESAREVKISGGDVSGDALDAEELLGAGDAPENADETPPEERRDETLDFMRSFN